MIMMIYLYRPLVVYPDKVIVDIGNEFGKFYRKLIPKYIKIDPPKYSTHITVIRSFEIFDQSKIVQYSNKQIIFHYDEYIYEDENRYYLNCWCDELCLIRRIAGLSAYRSDFQSFHVTIGVK